MKRRNTILLVFAAAGFACAQIFTAVMIYRTRCEIAFLKKSIVAHDDWAMVREVQRDKELRELTQAVKH